jgi:hypothetical protein
MGCAGAGGRPRRSSLQELSKFAEGDPESLVWEEAVSSLAISLSRTRTYCPELTTVIHTIAKIKRRCGTATRLGGP